MAARLNRNTINIYIFFLISLLLIQWEKKRKFKHLNIYFFNNIDTCKLCFNNDDESDLLFFFFLIALLITSIFALCEKKSVKYFII